jgi:aminotransferase
LQEAGVAVLPGTAFGSAGKGYLRLAYTQSDAAIGEALRRMEAFLRQNSEGGRP